MYSKVLEMEYTPTPWVLQAIESGKRRERDRGKPPKYFRTDAELIARDKLLNEKEDAANAVVKAKRQEQYIQWCINRHSVAKPEMRKYRTSPYDYD